MASFEKETVSMEELREGVGRDALEEAEVVIAVDEDTAEEVVLFGKWELTCPRE